MKPFFQPTINTFFLKFHSRLSYRVDCVRFVHALVHTQKDLQYTIRCHTEDEKGKMKEKCDRRKKNNNQKKEYRNFLNFIFTKWSNKSTQKLFTLTNVTNIHSIIWSVNFSICYSSRIVFVHLHVPKIFQNALYAYP